MFADILGLIWIVLGIYWLIRPESLKNRLSRKMTRKMRRVVFFFVLTFGLLMIGSVFRTPGFIPKIIMIAGLLVSIKAIRMITARTSESIAEWWEQRPVVFFRAWAAVFVVLGILMITAGMNF